MGQTHAVAGACAAAAVLAALHPPLAAHAVGLAAGAAAALLPDVDEPGSTVSRKLIVVGPAVAGALRHRTATHSLAAAAGAVLALRGIWPGVPEWLLGSVAAGYVSHLVADALTPEGAMWFWPLLGWRVSLTGWLPGGLSRACATGGTLERVLWRPLFFLGAVAFTLPVPGPAARW